VPDLRNTKVITIINELKDYGVKVCVHDPLAEAIEAKAYYNLELQQDIQKLTGVDGVIVAVIHKLYREIGLSKIAGLCTNGVPLVMDLKGAFSIAEADKLGITYWRL